MCMWFLIRAALVAVVMTTVACGGVEEGVDVVTATATATATGIVYRGRG